MIHVSKESIWNEDKSRRKSATSLSDAPRSWEEISLFIDNY